jgi:hypothetical protein
MFPFLSLWAPPSLLFPSNHAHPRSLILLFLLISGVHPNPGPSPLPDPNLNFLQLNVNGIKNSSSELSDFLVKHSIKIACLQETKLSARSIEPKFPEFSIVRLDRAIGGGGGLAFIIHDSVNYTKIDCSILTNADPSLELQAIQITVNGSYLDIFNVYLPPVSSCPAGHRPDFPSLLAFSNNDALLFGDFNAHHAAWFSPRDPVDPRGEHLAATIDATDFCTLNEDAHTRVPFSNNPSSSPDITLAPAHLLTSLTWSVHTTLNSDHLPIVVSYLTVDIPPRARRSFTNFRLANWPGFLQESEDLFSRLPPPTSCAKGEAKFREILQTASRHNIPSGYRKKFVKGLPNSAKHLIKERDRLRKLDPHDNEIPNLNVQIEECIRVSSRQRWRDEVESCTQKADPSKFWALHKKLSGKSSRPPPNQPISFKGKVYTKSPDIARHFCNLFTKSVRHKSDQRFRKVRRSLLARHKLDSNFTPFLPLATRDAINAAKNSTATGPDGLTAIHLKHLGPRGIIYLTSLFNLSVGGADLPAMWKAAIVVPILKPGKPADVGSSYRPISLLCPAAKVLERLLLPLISEALPKSETQHGFAPQHSCTTALLPIVTGIAIGFNSPKPARRTAVCALDISKAFDSIDHTLLIEQISSTTLHSNLVRWLAAYIRGRTARCSFGSVLSAPMIIRSGVPQGSVLSPCLFNFFVSDCPGGPDFLYSYADDFYVSASDPNLVNLSNLLQARIDPIIAWAARKKLAIAPMKSQVTLFTPWNKEFNSRPNVSVDGVDVPLCRAPRWLGSHLDSMFAFNNQSVVSTSKGSQRIKLMKAVSGTDWGHDKETLLITYRALVESVFTFNAPIWFPNSKPSNIQKLQLIQNVAMRLITGCHKAASIAHLHAESKLLPVAEHLTMLCVQFLARCLSPVHPSHRTVLLPPGPRKNLQGRPLKETLSSRFHADLVPYLQDGILPSIIYNRTKDAIHTAAVRDYLASAPPNKVLGTRPPDIHPSEESLPRICRTTLSQLRSDYCSSLNSYQFFINAINDDECPECNISPHSTSHLFSCPSHPTTLTVLDLWYKPVQAAAFLSGFPAFSHLPPLDLPLPPPPPEPPP